jgi:hypothetical protein
MNKKMFRKNFKKSIKSFIKDEDGFVNKDQILKIGLGTIGSLGILSSLSASYAATVYMDSCSARAHANLNAHQNGITCTAVGSCQRCTFHSNATGTHINHNSASMMRISGRGCLSGKGCANMDIRCPPGYAG